MQSVGGCDCGRGVQSCHGNQPGEGDQGECLQLAVTTSSGQDQQCSVEVIIISDLHTENKKEQKHIVLDAYNSFVCRMC